jgi:hypothetical protein
MSAANFAHAKKGLAKGGDFPTVHAVYVTVTIHESNDASDRTHDNVWYGNGVLKLGTKNNEEVLGGDIQMWINNVQMVELKSKPGGISVPVADLFPFAEQLKLRVSVSASGKVSLQKLVNNKAFLGRPPVEFQAACTNGLLTGVVDNSSYTLSFTNGQAPQG